MKEVAVNILKKGDTILNVFPFGEMMSIVVKRKGGSVDVTMVGRDDDGFPVIGNRIVIGEGNDSVEAKSGSFSFESF